MKKPKLRVVREAAGEDYTAKLRAVGVEREARRVQKAIMEEWDGKDADEAFDYALRIADGVRDGMQNFKSKAMDTGVIGPWLQTGEDDFKAKLTALDGKIAEAKATRELRKSGAKALRPSTRTQRAVLRGLMESVEFGTTATITMAGGLLDSWFAQPTVGPIPIPTTIDLKPIADLVQKRMEQLLDALRKYRRWLTAVGVGALALLALIGVVVLMDRRRR